MGTIIKKEIIKDGLNRELKYIQRSIKYSRPISYPYILLACENSVDNAGRVVREWAKENEINLFIISSGNEFPIERGGSIKEEYLSYTGYKSNMAFTDMISKPNTVLLLENANQLEQKYRHELMSIINNRAIIDDREEKGYKKLNNLLFAIITVGPMEPVDFNTLWRLDAKECRLIKVEEEA